MAEKTDDTFAYDILASDRKYMTKKEKQWPNYAMVHCLDTVVWGHKNNHLLICLTNFLETEWLIDWFWSDCMLVSCQNRSCFKMLWLGEYREGVRDSYGTWYLPVNSEKFEKMRYF